MNINRINIGIIILNYLAYEETIHCAAGFLKQEVNLAYNHRVYLKIIIVDNCSPNDSFKILKDKFGDHPLVNVVQTGRNLGFAGGNNYGYYVLTADMNPDFVVVSNEDIVLESGNLFRWVLDCFKQYHFGVAGPDIYSPNARFHQNPIRNFPLSISVCKLELWRYRYRKAANQSGLLITEPGAVLSKWENHHYQSPCLSQTLHGSFLVFSKLYFNEYSDLFYPHTFLYYEEDFLRLRCIRKNLVMVYEPSYQVIHLQSVSTNLLTAEKSDRFLTRINNQMNSLEKFLEELRIEYHPAIIGKSAAEEEAFLLKCRELADYLDNREKVYIYGAGMYGNECYFLLEDKKEKIAGFIVSDGEEYKVERKALSTIEFKSAEADMGYKVERKALPTSEFECGRAADGYKNAESCIPVYYLSEITPLRGAAGIIIAVGKAHRDSILLHLGKLGITDCIVYPMMH